MSLEKSLERIAEALEKIAENKKPVKTKCENKCKTLPKPKTEVPVPPVPPVPQVIQLSLEELNAELIKEFTRLGNDKSPIDKVISSHGATSLAEIDPSKYSEILKEVKNIKV